MSFIKEIFNSMARVIGRIFAYLLIGFLVYFFVSTFNVNAAQTITFDVSQYLRNNQNSINAYNIGNVINECYNATECEIPTSNLFLQNGFSANWYVGDSSISSEDYLILSGNSYTINFSYSIFNNSSTKDNFIPSLAIYNSSTSKWVLATCDVGETYSSTKYYQENDDTTYRQDFVYKCEKLNSTISGPTFRTALVLSDSSNLSGAGNWTSNLTLIDLNRDSGINDVINNQNQNTDKIIGAIDDLNDTINSTQLPGVDNFQYTDPNAGIITSFLTMPLTLLRVMSNTSTCQAVNLGELYGHPLILECVHPEEFLGNSLWTIIDYFIVFVMIGNIAQLFIYIYEKIKNLDDFFGEFYTPKHTKEGYTPRHGG